MKIERAAALKAVLTWVDLGVLKEEDTGLYKLLEVAEEASSSSNPVARQGKSMKALTTVSDEYMSDE